MKTTLLTTGTSFFLSLYTLNANAQFINGSVLNNNPAYLSNTSESPSFGGKLTIYTKPIQILKFNPANPINVRFGFGMGYSRLEQKKLNNIPLMYPQTGSASVTFTNGMFTLNSYARFSSSHLIGNFIEPYIEPALGLSCFSSDMLIKPSDFQYAASDTTLSSSSALQLGLNVGCVFKLSSIVSVDVALGKYLAVGAGTQTDMATVQEKNNAVLFCSNKTSPSLTQLSVGINISFGNRANKKSASDSKNREAHNDRELEYDSYNRNGYLYNSYSASTPSYPSHSNYTYSSPKTNNTSTHTSGTSRPAAHISTGSCNCGGRSGNTK